MSVGIKINYHLLTSIYVTKLQIPFYGFLNPRGELLVYSVYLILLPYKKWNPNNYIKIHILFKLEVKNSINEEIIIDLLILNKRGI
ncbi:EM14S01-3B_G0042930.mRNA.1.CDS.1 [Saccharomyces cerevisiae]|nr:EM14S01-3B_G0042930.mRNA.1.CDS.1 [Saccharomyces cerevisiae]